MQRLTPAKLLPKFRASLGIKLIAIALVALLIIFSVSIYQSQQAIINNLQGDASRELSSAAAVLDSKVEGDKAAALMVAASIANRADVQELVFQKDRQLLEDRLTPLFGLLNDQHKVVHFNLIDERGVVILRLSDPDNFGDYVFYNAVVTNTINTLRQTGGFEVDTSGLSMRGAAPIFYEGTFVGLVEIGIDYAQDFTNVMKQKTRADFLVWFYKPSTARFGVEFEGETVDAPNENFLYYAGTKTEDLSTESGNLQEAFSTFDRIMSLNVESRHASLMVPILGPDATFFGVTEISFDYAARVEAERLANITEQLSIVGLSILGLIVVGIAINFLAISPLQRITRFAEDITEGMETTSINLKTGDEFEQVAEALNIMAASITQKREDLERQVSQRTAQLQASNEVAKVANSILDPDKLISTVINLITENFGYYYAAIFQISEDGRWAEIKDATGAAGEALKTRRHRLQVGGNSMVGSAISMREARIALDVGATPVRFNNPLLPNTRSEIALPLVVGDRVIGALDAQSIREGDFMEEDIATLQSMANQVAIALENARLFREMNTSLEELRQSNQEFVTTAWQDKLKSGKLEHSARNEIFSSQEADDLVLKEILVPLNLREQPIGEIALEISQDWSEEDQAWVEALATQVAISLENSRLLEESQQTALREQLSASIVQKVWSSSNIDTIIQTTVRELARSLDAAEVKIELKTD
jgi:GAF domain-containing protein/HAMP domain-containing protein